MSRDPRLVWRALAQPDLSAASAAQARGADAFRQGLDGARTALERAQEDRLRRNSAEVAAELAGLDSPEAINQWLENGGLNGRDVSPELMQAMLGLRGDMVDQELTRARIDSVGLRDGLAISEQELRAQERADARASQSAFDAIAARIAGGGRSSGSSTSTPAPAAPAPGPTAAVPDTFRIGPTAQLDPNRLQWGEL